MGKVIESPGGSTVVCALESATISAITPGRLATLRPPHGRPTSIRGVIQTEIDVARAVVEHRRSRSVVLERRHRAQAARSIADDLACRRELDGREVARRRRGVGGQICGASCKLECAPVGRANRVVESVATGRQRIAEQCGHVPRRRHVRPGCLVLLNGGASEPSGGLSELHAGDVDRSAFR